MLLFGGQSKMPDLLCTLKELIASQVPIHSTTEGDSSRSVTLQELDIRKDPISQEVIETRVVSSVTIDNLPERAFVFRADAFPQPQALFDSVFSYVRKRADYILLANESGKKRIVYIEMKKEKDSEDGIIAQLKGAACVMDYCKAVLTRFFEISGCFIGAEERFVSLSGTTGKRSTHPDRNALLHDSPERLLKLKGHSFSYRELIRR